MLHFREDAMRFHLPTPHAAWLALGCGALLAGPALAQTAKPPKAQLWMDLSTGSMAGMPEMDLPAGMGGMLGGLMGGRGGAGGPGGGNVHYGQARSMNIMPPRVLDIALYNSLKPGVEAEQAIPPGMRMGERLPLVPPKPQQPVREADPGETPEEYREPKGRILIYWGCGSEVRPGQPRVIDFSRGNPADWGKAFAGRYAPDRGARVGPSHALFPNEKNRVQLARDSSLVGEHQVQGEGVPASFKFALGAAQDIMPPIELQSRGGLQDSIALNWRGVTNARAYFLHAMGSVGENDLVMWSSSETPDTGMGLFDYLPNATIDRWLREKVLLQPDTLQCAVPKGIFAAAPGGAARRGEGGGMLRMMAYGSESNFVHPSRPADPKAAWEPEWAVRVRVKSHTMAMLGEEQGARGGAASRGAPMPAGQDVPPSGPPATGGAEPQPAIPLPNPVNILRGIFGR
jgi:hypothetical protein